MPLEKLKTADAEQEVRYQYTYTLEIYFIFADHCLLKVAASEFTAEVQPHRDDLKQIGGRLMEIEQLLKSSRDLQLPLNENVTNVVSELAKLSMQVQKLSQDRDNTETKLQRNERDCMLLSEMLTVHDDKEKCQLLQRIIDYKERKIKRLKEELKQKECKLECTQQEAKELQEKLSKVQDELKVIHEDVKALQKEKKELTRSYNSEREKVSKLVQSAFALTSDREEMKVL